MKKAARSGRIRPGNGRWRNRIVASGEEAPDALLANPKNWRTHPKAQREALAGVLDEVGWVQEVIVNRRTGLMVDGHLRVELARERGEAIIPVKYVDLEEGEEALVLATLDPLAGMAVAAKDKLAELLDNVHTGDEALQGMLADLAVREGIVQPTEGLTDPDAVPEAVEPVAKRGDVWLCGEHRVMCGDSTDEGDVARLMAGEKAGLMVTDPPYGVDVGKKYKMRSLDSRGGPRFRQDGLAVANDDLSDESTRELWAAALSPWAIEGDVYVFCPPGPYTLGWRSLSRRRALAITNGLSGPSSSLSWAVRTTTTAMSTSSTAGRVRVLGLALARRTVCGRNRSPMPHLIIPP